MERAMFLNYKEFVKRRHQLKQVFSGMDREERQIYKWYIYANCLLTTKQKDLIWEYLHNDISNKRLKRGW